ncbi:MAG: hypothetical protein WKF30_19585 [Pyrinomonadaceae bacterium]
MQTKRTENGHFRLIPLQALATSPTNPRQSFDTERLAQLAASIKERGVFCSPLHALRQALIRFSFRRPVQFLTPSPAK